MPVYALDKSLWFPPATEYEEHGIVAVGGDLSLERLLEAYKQGIFPWYNQGEPITWWCPKMRMVLPPAEVKISKSSRNVLNQKRFSIKADVAFEEVINHCQKVKRKGQQGTWLNDELKQAMVELHQLGYAHSIESYDETDTLVGGLYGLGIGRIFCGDSMFSLKNNASKIAFVSLCRVLARKEFKWIDCQVYNEHLASLGAYELPRSTFLKETRENMKAKTLRGPWTEWFRED